MARIKVRLPLPRKTGGFVPSRGKERREPLVVNEPGFCADCDAQLDADGQCPNSNIPAQEEEW